MGCFSPSQPAPLNYGKILDQTLTTQIGLQPLLQSAEAQWDPAQVNQSLNNMNSLLFGSAGGQFDVPTYTPAIFQSGNQLSYGGVPKGFLGQVNNPYLGTVRNPGPGAAGLGFANGGGGGLNATELGAMAGGALGPMGAAAGSSIGSFVDTGNPDPISAALGLNFWGGPSKVKIAGPQYGTQTVTQAAQPGLVQQMSQLNSMTRAANVNDIANLGPGALAAIQATNPQMAGLMNTLNTQAQDELNAGSGLTPEEQRLMQQQTRASWASRGLDGTNASAADEVLQQYALGQQLQRQRQQFAQGVVSQDQNAYQDPTLSLLMQGGQGTSAQAQGMMPGTMFNPESPFAGNIAAANQQMAALFADPSTLSKINMVGSTAGNTLGSLASIAGGIAGI